MRNSVLKSVVGMGIAAAMITGVAVTAAYAQTAPPSQAELNEYADLAFKGDRTAAEQSRFEVLQAKIKEHPPIEALEGEQEPTFASTTQLKRPYLEIAPDFGITRLNAGIKYRDSYYVDSASADADGTSARAGLDVRVNIPVNDNLEFFAGGWSFVNFAGNAGLHNQEEEELETTDGFTSHRGVLGYSVNNFITAYTGISLPFYEHFCDCFGAVQFSLNPYVGARVGQIDLELDYTNGFGSTREKETKTFVTPLAGIELKARSGRLLHSGLQLGAAIGYQYQGGTDASIKGEVGDEHGKFEFDVENQQHFYGSLRVGYSF